MSGRGSLQKFWQVNNIQKVAQIKCSPPAFDELWKGLFLVMNCLFFTNNWWNIFWFSPDVLVLHAMAKRVNPVSWSLVFHTQMATCLLESVSQKIDVYKKTHTHMFFFAFPLQKLGCKCKMPLNAQAAAASGLELEALELSMGMSSSKKLF